MGTSAIGPCVRVSAFGFRRASDAAVRFGDAPSFGRNRIIAVLVQALLRLTARKRFSTASGMTSGSNEHDSKMRQTARKHLRVFLASPGDVSGERVVARQVLEQLPYDRGLRDRISVGVVAWDHPGSETPMLATMTPQAAIAKGLPKPSDCDIVIVVLWSRMGTPLPADDPKWLKADGTRYMSGTEWEYLDALAAHQRTGRPEILVYRCTRECLMNPS